MAVTSKCCRLPLRIVLRRVILMVTDRGKTFQRDSDRELSTARPSLDTTYLTKSMNEKPKDTQIFQLVAGLTDAFQSVTNNFCSPTGLTSIEAP